MLGYMDTQSAPPGSANEGPIRREVREDENVCTGTLEVTHWPPIHDPMFSSLVPFLQNSNLGPKIVTDCLLSIAPENYGEFILSSGSPTPSPDVGPSDEA